MPTLLVFDILTLNSDRNSDGNYLIVRPDFSPSTCYFAAIDHGHCFGTPQWDSTLRAKVGLWTRSMLPEVSQLIQGTNPFQKPLERLATLSKQEIEQIVALIPDEWNVTTEERSALIDYLFRQKDMVGQILDQNRDLFPLWRGGGQS